MPATAVALCQRVRTNDELCGRSPIVAHWRRQPPTSGVVTGRPLNDLAVCGRCHRQLLNTITAHPAIRAEWSYRLKEINPVTGEEQEYEAACGDCGAEGDAQSINEHMAYWKGKCIS